MFFSAGLHLLLIGNPSLDQDHLSSIAGAGILDPSHLQLDIPEIVDQGHQLDLITQTAVLKDHTEMIVIVIVEVEGEK